MIELVVAACGVTLLLMGARARRRDDVALAHRLHLPHAEHELDLARIGSSRLARASLHLASPLSGDEPTTVDTSGDDRVTAAVKIVIVAAVVGAVVGIATDQVVLAAVGAVVVPSAIAITARTRRQRTQRKMESQVPRAMDVLATSLESGAPLERSLELLATRSEQPLRNELERVVAEVQLGSEPSEAVEHMAARVQIDDVRWFAYALRIQRRSGGAVAPLARLLATQMEQRDALRREAAVLTAEGRLTAYVLGALPLGVLMAIQLSNPDYLQPFFAGWGPVVLLGLAASVMFGIALILRMVNRAVPT